MNMKKILSIALSLVMIMALFTGCGSNKNAKTKDNGSYFKEVKKMQEIKTGTGKYAEAGCQNVREWGHRVYRKVDGAGSI